MTHTVGGGRGTMAKNNPLSSYAPEALIQTESSTARAVAFNMPSILSAANAGERAA